MPPIAPQTLLAIRDYLDRKLGLLSLDEDTALFLINRGKPYIPNKLFSLLKQYIQYSGIKNMGSCKKFRYTTATLMLKNRGYLCNSRNDWV